MTAAADNPTATPPRIRSFHIAGPVGNLEALLNEGQTNAPCAVLLAHPHPLGGGSMHNKVVYHTAKVFSSFGWPVLRFNFRGTGLSQGRHHGIDESLDVIAALDWLAQAVQRPVLAAGFSFGAAMGLKAASQWFSSAAATASPLASFLALGLPTQAEGRVYTHPYLPECKFPKFFLSGERDQYAPIDQLQSVIDSAPEPKTFVSIPGADHFFTGHLPAMQAALTSWILSSFVPGEASPL